MNKMRDLLSKILVVGVIVLFIGVAVQPVMGTIKIELRDNHKKIYTPILWFEQAKLLALDGTEWDCFGCSVSIYGDYVVIGADRDDNKGSAYIFKRNGSSWIEEQKLTASDGESLDHFGESVSMDGDYVVIGAILDDDNGDKSGSAYIFKYNGIEWIEGQKLTALDGENWDRFGFGSR